MKKDKGERECIEKRGEGRSERREDRGERREERGENRNLFFQTTIRTRILVRNKTIFLFIFSIIVFHS
jgi:hypothetical protein